MIIETISHTITPIFIFGIIITLSGHMPMIVCYTSSNEPILILSIEIPTEIAVKTAAIIQLIFQNDLYCAKQIPYLFTL